MISGGQIDTFQREAAERACALRRVPFVFWPEDVISIDSLRLPNLGSYVPEGWEKVDGVLVTGWGTEGSILGPEDFEDLLKAIVAEYRTRGRTVGWATTCGFEFYSEVSWFERLDER